MSADGAGRRYDVVIAGAGPAGAATAMVLARAGVSVALVDRARFPRPKACAEYFSPGVVDILERLRVWQQVARLPHARLTGMELVGPGGGRHLVAYPDDPLPRRSLTVRRDLLDAALLEQAAAAGATLFLGHAVRDVMRSGRRATGLLVQHADTLTELPAQLVIGADGTRSIVAHRLGLEAPRRWPARLGLVAHYDGVEFPTDYGEMHLASGVYCGLAPLGNGGMNVGFVTSAATARRLGSADAIFAWVRHQLPNVAQALRNGRQVGTLRGSMPLAHRCYRTFTDGALLVGDAAGFLDPFTGEGVFRALRGAELAAAVALDALKRGDVSARTLAPYAALRRRTFVAKDALCLLIQLFVARPRLLDYAIPRLNARGEARALAAALGDYRPAARVLTPPMLWRLLAP
jgi:geranylgeranyl reductase family protein